MEKWAKSEKKAKTTKKHACQFQIRGEKTTHTLHQVFKGTKIWVMKMSFFWYSNALVINVVENLNSKVSEDLCLQVQQNANVKTNKTNESHG